MNDIVTQTAPAPRVSLVAKMATRFNVEPAKLMNTLKATAFKTDKDKPQATDEQLMALLIVADQYGLNPFTKEIFAFPDKGGIVPVVSVDGWTRIINEHPQFDGVGFETTVTGDEGPACTCTIYRKDRAHPTVITEFLNECKRSTGPWGSHPRRMLRHKALIQCARVAFGFAGVFDEDEAVRIVKHMGEADEVNEEGGSNGSPAAPMSAADALAARRREKQAAAVKPTDKTESERRSVEYFLEALNQATSEETALLVIDEARGELTDDEQGVLVDAFKAKWGT